MCGICGKLNVSTQPVKVNLLRRMTRLLEHRGPDDEGFHFYRPGGPGQPSLGLGHRRLSIIDLSTNGKQPLSNEDGTVWVILNGEIYNFQELRKELEEKGHHFRSNSDTEILVHLYEEENKAARFLSRLRGMFAFAVWDESKHRLLLARDRTGEKPLFYSPLNGGLVFSSTLESLLSDPEIPREPNWDALGHYIRYMCVPSPRTAFKEVWKLPPGHFLSWERGEIRTERYWNLLYSPKVNIGEREAAEELLSLLKEAVRLRLISDVPLGAFLSGGIDSAAVVALMAEIHASSIKTFSIGFEDSAYDERPQARLVAERFGTEHHEFVVYPNAVEVLPDLVRHFGEPFADSSALPTYYLSKLTRGQVTVALSGDGGDEAFGGYDRYIAMGLSEKLRAFPGGRTLAGALTRLFSGGGGPRTRAARLTRFCTSVASFPDPASRYAWLLSGFQEDVREVLTRPSAENDEPDPVVRLMTEEVESLGPVEAAIRSDFYFYLPEDLLVKLDVASMAHALEARCPFLDHHVLEFTARLPLKFKVDGKISKALLKKHILKDLLPNAILNQKKHGFGVPLGRWFTSDLRPFFEDTLLEGQASEIIRPEFAQNIYDDHISGGNDHGSRLWMLLCLALWYREFF